MGSVLYILPQQKKRFLIPQITLLLFLSIIFYLGVLLNVSLLELSPAQETKIKLISLLLLVFLFILGVFLNFKKAQQKYYFYADRLVFQKKEIFLNQIQSLEEKKNLLDKLFQTYSLVLNTNFRIKYIPQGVLLKDYLQKLINYSKNLGKTN